MTRFSQLERIMDGKVIQLSHDYSIESLSLDSRKVSDPTNTLFFAIAGDRHDGHDYIQGLYDAGVRQFIVEKDINLSGIPLANILRVTSSVHALQRLATDHRKNFAIPVVGITGSNGKTIVKEWLFQMLSAKVAIAKNPGSYNSQVGVPLSVWQLQSHHEVGIFEAGISKPGEMENLERVISPSIGIFTNIGTAHDEGFHNLEEKINEKLNLFRHSDVVIYCRDHEEIHRIISKSSLPTFSWGSAAGADIRAAFDGGICSLQYQSTSFRLELPFTDAASRENCLHGVATMVYLGYAINDIQTGISTLRAVPMRMELREGINHCQLVDDTYNNDLAGLEIALQFLAHQHQKSHKRVILSDILESGLADEELVRRIAHLIAQNRIFAFVGIGRVLGQFAEMFPTNSSFYPSTEDFLRDFDFSVLHDEILLVKGARYFEFEKVVNRLQRRVHGTVMEINLNSLTHNLNLFRSRLKPTTKVMVMVKAFAYGSGSVEIANILQYHRVDYLGVAYPDEGVELRRNNIQLPVMVMNPAEESFEIMLEHKLEPEVYSPGILRALISFLKGRACKVHLKLDTGMHRLGFDPWDISALISLLVANRHIQIASIFSHLAGSDDSMHDAFSAQQFKTFVETAAMIEAAVGYHPLLHMLNSSGILRLPDMQLDMVRLGIGLYGVDPTAENQYGLKPVATLKTIISQVKTIQKGESIGYGRAGIALRDLQIAIIAIGYADGYSRGFSGGIGEVLIRGHRAPVIGNVCMDMTMIDVTGLDTHDGDEVIIFGSGFPIQEIARKLNTIPYEILTSTSERVKRVFLSDGV